MFNWTLADEQVRQPFSAWFRSISIDPIVLLGVVSLILFNDGMFVDVTTATQRLVRVVPPPIIAAGVDPDLSVS